MRSIFHVIWWVYSTDSLWDKQDICGCLQQTPPSLRATSPNTKFAEESDEVA